MHALTADQISLVPRLDLSRRLFAVTSLAAGFASAVMPVSAATVTADTEGLEVGEAKVAVRDGDMPAYYARPMREAVRQAGKTSEFQVYPEAGHGFHADYRPSYDETAARMAGPAALPGSASTASAEAPRPPRPPACHAGLEPGSRVAARRCPSPATPGPPIKSGVTEGAGEQGVRLVLPPPHRPARFPDHDVFPAVHLRHQRRA
jgi:hypothetical protein